MLLSFDRCLYSDIFLAILEREMSFDVKMERKRPDRMVGDSIASKRAKESPDEEKSHRTLSFNIPRSESFGNEGQSLRINVIKIKIIGNGSY